MRLFEPITVAGHTLENRAVITSHLGHPGCYSHPAVAAEYRTYIRRRVESGVGMITLACVMAPALGFDADPDFDAIGAELEALAEIIHGHGSIATAQINHMGAQAKGMTQPGLTGVRAMAATQLPDGPMAHAMTSDELEAVSSGFGRMAKLAHDAGLDGVELHASHGYLLHQSFSRWMNTRDDRWGEPLTLLKSVVTATRDNLPPEAIVGVRFPTHDHRSTERGGRKPTELRDLALETASWGLMDYINPSEGSGLENYGVVVGSYRRPPGEFLDRTADLRKKLAGRLTVMGVGRVTTAEAAEEALARGDCDLIGLTRAHIADPEFLTKARNSQSHRIRRCVGANQGCIDRAHEGQVMTCFVNPEVGRENALPTPSRTIRRTRVLVVGAGPAGLKAAEVSAARGHEVIVAERRGRVGGRLGCISEVSAAHELTEAVGWMMEEIHASDVEVRLSTRADGQLLDELGPDAVVVATGSLACIPRFEHDGSLPVVAPDDAVDASSRSSWSEELVWDSLGTEEGAVVVEQLAAAGVHVQLATPHATAGQHLGYTSAVDHVERLVKLGCGVHERARGLRISAGSAHVTTFLGDVVDMTVDAVVSVAPRRTDTALVAELQHRWLPYRIIGDAFAHRSAMEAIREGYDVAHAIETIDTGGGERF